jgi:hypothetical protein
MYKENLNKRLIVSFTQYINFFHGKILKTKKKIGSSRLFGTSGKKNLYFLFYRLEIFLIFLLFLLFPPWAYVKDNKKEKKAVYRRKEVNKFSISYSSWEIFELFNPKIIAGCLGNIFTWIVCGTLSVMIRLLVNFEPIFYYYSKLAKVF